MKKVIYSIFFMIFSFTTIFPQIGCIDNSKHLDTSDGCDDKRYHYVYCTCNCERYLRTYNRGRCEQCWHYHIPQELIVVRYNPHEEYPECPDYCITGTDSTD